MQRFVALRSRPTNRCRLRQFHRQNQHHFSNLRALDPLQFPARPRPVPVRHRRPSIRNQFFASLNRFSNHPYFAGWSWLESEVKTPDGGFLFGATDQSGNIEGIHDQFDSPAALLVDECKSVRDDILDALSRCHTTFRLFISSTGAAFGGF
jgi:hypothetical protein